MVYSETKLKANSDKTSPSFKLSSIEDSLDKSLPVWTLQQVPFIHILISLASAMGLPNAVRMS